jgi:hypothetical protein
LHATLTELTGSPQQQKAQAEAEEYSGPRPTTTEELQDAAKDGQVYGSAKTDDVSNLPKLESFRKVHRKNGGRPSEKLFSQHEAHDNHVSSRKNESTPNPQRGTAKRAIHAVDHEKEAEP